jgi:hypothetical protein
MARPRKLKRATHVRYESPYNSPSAYMKRETAAAHLARDDARWVRDQQLGLFSDKQRRHGPPQIVELPR